MTHSTTLRAGPFTPISASLVKKTFPKRDPLAQKWDFGHCLIVAGSHRFFGASVLAAKAALRGGCGLVTLAVPASLQTLVYAHVLEPLTLALPETPEGSVAMGALKTIDAFIGSRAVTSIVMGPGMTRQEETARFMHALCASSSLPMVLDADAISAQISLPKQFFRVLTPQRRELARLCETTEEEVLKNGAFLAAKFAEKHPQAALVMKGHHSKIFMGKSRWENTTGNPGMAKGGSGDVLAGLMGSFLAQTKDLKAHTNAVLSAVYLHGLAGDLAARVLTQQALKASDLIDFIPGAYKKAEIA